ncbi:MAG: hypothetical protein LLG14_05285 [Nocardiaceae bacterium]|nr:hypothetical protein [Nocardiaceae bacterium]
MSELVVRAQMMLLAQLLHVDQSEIAGLERLGADKLNELRERISGILFDENADVFKLMSMMVPLVPLRIALPIVQKIVPPEMAGRAAGAIAMAHPKKVAVAMPMLKPAYAASAAPYIDPRAVDHVAHLAPPGPVVEIAREILGRGDYTTGGLFVASATHELILAVEAGIDDDEGLIRSGAYVYDARVLSEVVGVVLSASTDRIHRMIRTVANGPKDLRLAALSVMSRIDPPLIGIVGDVLFGETEQAVVTDLIRTFVAEGVLDDLFVLVKSLTPFAMDRVAENPVIADPDFLDLAIRTAANHTDDSIWAGIIDVVARTAPDLQQSLLEKVLAHGRGLPERIAGLATEQNLWVPLLSMFAGQPVKLQDRVAKAWAPLLHDRRILAGAVDAITAYPDDSVWNGLLAIGERTDPQIQTLILEMLLERGDGLAVRIAPLATAEELWPPLLRMLARQDEALRQRAVDTWMQHMITSDREIVLATIKKEGLGRKLSSYF